MTLNARQEQILKQLRADGEVAVDDLARAWDVTTQTVRRDLSDLCARGLATRTHGGARRMIANTAVAYEDRRQNNILAKQAIADAAVRLIPDGASLALNIGTTTEMVAESLRLHSDLTIVSNNINIVPILRQSRLRSLFLIGGEVRLTDGAVVGGDAVNSINNFRLDYAIIGASSMTAEGGVLDFDVREVAVARAILKNADHRILVADSSKFGISAMHKICDVAELDHIVVDRPPPPAFQKRAIDNDTQLIIAQEQGDA